MVQKNVAVSTAANVVAATVVDDGKNVAQDVASTFQKYHLQIVCTNKKKYIKIVS